MKKTISLLLLCALLLSSAASCSNGTGEEESKTGGSTPTDQTGGETSGESGAGESGEETETEAETEPERFTDVNYNGRDFRVYTSIDTNDGTNQNALIEGSGEQTGDRLNDAVYDRNLTVEDKLGITLQFEEANFDYNQVKAQLTNLIMAGIDAYDVVINDMNSLVELSAENRFYNVANSDIFDFTKSYWYDDAMRDLCFVEDGMYCLIGDYFADALASCHVLYVNESMLEDKFGDAELVNNKVLDGSWTDAAFLELSEGAMEDVDGGGTQEEGDIYGFTCIGMLGSAYPFLIGTGIEFVDRTDDGTVEFIFNNDRSVQILEMLNNIFWSDSVLTTLSDNTPAGARNLFANGYSLFLGYNRLSDLANLNDVAIQVGVVPYPKLDDAQENYVTSMHDTSEIGGIPVTVQPANLEFVETCLEVLSIESAKTVIPEFYENGLKLRYINDEGDAAMIDLIHDAIGSPFGLAYNRSLSRFMLQNCFATPLSNKSTDFASSYQQASKSANKSLRELAEKFADVYAKQSGN